VVKRLLPSALLLAIVIAWGWTFTVVKDAVAICGVVPFLAVRFAIGSACVGVFAARGAELRSLRTGAWIGLALAAAYLLQTFGLRYSTATNTGLITGLFIVFTPLANRVLFGVRTRRVLWAAIAVSLCGLALLTGAGPQGLRAGDGLTLGCAACFGLHVALLDRYSKGHRAVTLALGQLTSATVLLASVWAVQGPIRWPPAEVWPALLLTGGICTAAAFFVQTFAQQRLSAVETGMIILTEPIFAAVFGWLLAGDRLTGLQILGAGLMVAAVFAAEIYPLVRRRRLPAEGSKV
jgi:drug/metabolite transporter (DMT)-like permease